MKRAAAPVIRPAEAADVRALMAMIHELGTYQGEPDAVVGTAQQLAEHLFGPRQAAEVLVGLVDDRVVGFALFYPSFSVYLTQPTLYLADLFVLPEFRGAGLGKALVLRVAATAVERGHTRLDFTVLDDNRLAIDFYEALGARAMQDWTNFRIEDEALLVLAKSVQG